MTDRLVFRNAAHPGDIWVGWTGPWPPPDRMLVITGAQTGQTAITPADTLDDPERAPYIQALRDDGATVEHFTLAGASQQPAPAPKGAHWFRGAEYVPEAGP